MSKITRHVVLTFCLSVFVACDPQIKPTEEKTQAVSDLGVSRDLTLTPDMSCPTGYMRCVLNEISTCVPELCGGCGGVLCTPNQPDCCNGKCVNFRNYHDNCGSCGTVCTVGYCAEGRCVN